MNKKGMTGIEVVLCMSVLLIFSVRARIANNRYNAVRLEQLMFEDTGKRYQCAPVSWAHTSGVGECLETK